MPQPGNVLVDFGIGPLTLRDTFIRGLPHYPSMPKLFWTLLTTVASLSAGVLFYRVLTCNRSAQAEEVHVQRAHKSLLIFVSLLTASYLALISALRLFFDRYLLLPIPLVMILLVLLGPSRTRTNSPLRRLHTILAFSMIVTYSAFSVAAMHDYLSWNRARWDALFSLTRYNGIPAWEIDGGFEFNGWHLYDASYRGGEKGWWWVHDDKYVIAFGPLPGYIEIARYTFARWIPPAQGTISVLKRVSSSHDSHSAS